MPDDLDALARGEARRPRRASPGGGRRARRSRRRAGRPSPRTTKPSSGRLDLGAEPAQALDDGGDPVGLLERAAPARRGRPSRPRRSSRAAPRAAARRSPAAPRRARRRCRRAAPARRRGRRPARSAGTSSPARSSRSPSTIAAHPLERSAGSPVRVQLTPTSLDDEPRAGDEHAGGDEERGRGRVAGDVDVGRARARRRCRRVTRRSVAARRRRPAAQQHALGVVAAAARLGHAVVAVGQQPGEQHARLDLRAGDRQLVVDRRAGARPWTVNGGKRPVARVDRGAHQRAAARRSGRRAGGGSTRRRRASSARPSWPASQPGSRRISVPALPTSIGPSGSLRARAGRRRGRRARPPRCSTSAPSARTRVERRVACPPASR